MLQLASIFDPTWLHFGRVLASNLLPTWPQDALKTHSQNHQKTDHILNRLWNDFWWVLASMLGHFGCQVGTIFGRFLALGANLGQDAAQSRPRGPPGPILDDFKSLFGRFWNPTWWILAGFKSILSDFWCFCGGFWTSTCWMLAGF